MPIRPPQFNVPALSPSALLAARRQESSIGDDILQSVLGFTFRKQLQEQQIEALGERQESREEAAMDRAIARALGRGEIREVSEAPTVTFPGEDVPQEVPTFEAGGRRFVSTQQERALRGQAEFQRPVTQFGGRETLPGATAGDFVGPGGATISESQRQSLLQGEKEYTLGLLQGLLENAPDEGTRRQVQAAINRVENDPRFSVREQEEIIRDFGPGQAADFGEILRAEGRMSEERRSRYATALRNAHMRFGVRNEGEPGTAPRIDPLTNDEAHIVAMAEVGRADELAPQDQERLPELRRRLSQRPQPANIQEMFRDHMVAAGTPDDQDNNAFAIWLLDMLRFDDEGNIQNTALAERIRQGAGDDVLNFTTLSRWGRTGDSALFRAAFAAKSLGYMTEELVRNNLAATGVTIPVSYEGLIDAYSLADPNFDNMDVPRSAPEPGPQDEPATTSQFSQRRQEWRQRIGRLREAYGKRNADRFLQELLSAAHSGDTREQVVENLRMTATNQRNAGREAEADIYAGMAARAERDFSEFVAFRDSVLTHAARGEGVPF